MALHTCFAKQDTLYEQCLMSFNELLEEDPSIMVEYDSHYKIVPSKGQQGGESPISQIGTPYI